MKKNENVGLEEMRVVYVLAVAFWDGGLAVDLHGRHGPRGSMQRRRIVETAGWRACVAVTSYSPGDTTTPSRTTAYAEGWP